MDISVQTFTCRLEDYSSPKLQHCKGLFSKHSHSDLLNYNQQASNCELKFENILMKKRTKYFASANSYWQKLPSSAVFPSRQALVVLTLSFILPPLGPQCSCF